MNKLFTKIVRACLGLTMAVGVGVAVASNSRETTPVHAAGTSDWQKVTSLSGLKDGGTYLIVDAGDSYYLNGGVTSKPNFNATAFNSSNPTSTSAAGVLTFHKLAADNTFTLQLASTSKYVGCTKTGSGGATVSLNSDSYGWTFTFSSDTFNAQYQQSGKQGFIRFYSSGPDFRPYATTGNGTGLHIYEPKASKTLSSIAISGDLTTKSYTTAESWSKAGLTVTGTYSDSTTADLTSSATFKYYDSTGTSEVTPGSLGEGTHSIKVEATAGGKTSEKYSITGITITAVTFDNNSSLEEGEYFIKIASKYFNGSVSSGKGALQSEKPGDAGKFTFTLVGDDEWSVINKSGNRLGITGTNSTNLFCGSNNTYTFKVIDGSNGTFKLNSIQYTARYVACYNSTDLRTYATGTGNATYEFTLEPTTTKTLSSIALSGSYPTSFTTGNSFSHEGMTVTANYSDSTSADVTSNATFSGYNMSTAGNQTVTVSYSDSFGSATTTYSITVSAPATPYITPAKNSTSGYEGTNESISFTYGNLTGSLSITSSNTSIVTVGTPSTNAGSGSVQINFVAEGSTTVKFKDGSSELASLSVSVDPATVSISGLPASSSVFINKTLNLGSTITVTATGNLTSAVTWTSDDDSIAEVSSSGVVTGVAEGTVDITVTSDDYPSATMTCSVTVSEESGTADHPYTVNQAFAAIDANEGITGVYAQGIVSSIVTAWNTQYNNISFNISADGTTSGNQLEAFRAASGTNVTLTANDNINVGDIAVVKGNLKKYNSIYEFDAACTVEVRKHISSISVTTAPTKTIYNAGESFNPTGLIVTATYDDNSTKTFSYASVGSLFTFNKTTLVKTDTEVTVTLFGAFSASQSITVNPVPAVLSVTVLPDTLSLDIGESDDLTATVEVDAGASQAVTWSSSDENIATVDEYGTVSGVAKGSATITATSDFDDTKSGSCTVTVTDPNSKDYTWNLTTNSYDSSSADAIIWSNEAATITAAKGSSSTAANNQAPPAKAFTRILYSGQTFTIAPKATYTITSIVLTKSGGADISSSTWTNATASSSGNTITITPTDGTSNVSVAGSGYIQLTSIYIEYVKDTSTKSISLNDSTLDVALSSQSTTAIVETNFTGGTYTVDTNACASVTISGTTVTVTGIAVGSHTFTITETTNSLSVELTVNVYDPTDVYTKITSVTDLVDGARVYIGKITGEKLMGNKHSDKNYMDEIATGSASTTIDGSNSYVSYLIGADENGYYFKNESDNSYLCYSGSDNEMKTTDTYSNSDLTMHWTVSITDGSALVTNVGDTSRTMRYNAQNTRFACYLNEGQAPVSFFVRNLAGVTSSDRVNTFSNLYMHKLDVPTSNEEYTGNCYGTDGSDGYFATARAALNSERSSIAEAFSQSGDMWSRYVAWGDACGIAVSYSNGIHYNSRSIAPLFSTIIGKDANTVAIIVVISMVSVTAIGGYFFLRKCKENI